MVWWDVLPQPPIVIGLVARVLRVGVEGPAVRRQGGSRRVSRCPFLRLHLPSMAL